MATFNEQLSERFGGRWNGQRHGQLFHQPERPVVQVGPAIRSYMSISAQVASDQQSDWLSLPELPTSSEILPDSATLKRQKVERLQRSPAQGVNPNKPTGPWDSEEDYLRDQYRLIREDAVRPLRDAVALLRECPGKKEADFDNQIGIYDRVFIKGFTFATRGIAVRVAFSTNKAEKTIRWDMSKRLLSGSLIALTPTNDMFRTQCIVAIVAARPLENLELKPAELDLFLAKGNDLSVMPHETFVMVEARGGYYEAHRHTMKALQHMIQESFPLSRNLVFAEPEVGAPPYLKGDRRRMDLSGIFSNLTTTNLLDDLENLQIDSRIDVLNNWSIAETKFYNLSQQAAIRRILTKRLALVQGPPGTGKTYVSAASMRVILDNMCAGDPPVIIACHTNHALDQILGFIAYFESAYARLGAFSKHPEIRKRSLANLRSSAEKTKIFGDLMPSAISAMKQLERDLKEDLEALDPQHQYVDPAHFLRRDLMSQQQYDSFEKGASKLIQDYSGNKTPFEVWLGDELVPAEGTKKFTRVFWEAVEDPETEMEVLKEIEAENVGRDDGEAEALKGRYYCVAHTKTGNVLVVRPGEEKQRDKLLGVNNLWEVPRGYRGKVYREWLEGYKRLVSKSLQAAAPRYAHAAEQKRVAGWERDLFILRKQRVIGMTTTGLSKYRALINALEPRTILIEEAGESLEGSVTSACLPSVEQLILVGDHQQLKPQCHVQLHGETLNMNTSLFERLVNNGVEYDILTQQCRMRPEIRRLLQPIYGDVLQDHELVTFEQNRPPVKGMGGINSFFFNHDWHETRDANMSFVNYPEADMIAGFFNFLCQSGESPGTITVLTFYKGQRNEIDRLIRNSSTYRRFLRSPHDDDHNGTDNHRRSRLEVRTVDSYQGEEKDIILLALTRGGADGSTGIGFLRDTHRVCVALSRARRGLYLFGNANQLHAQSAVWRSVLNILGAKRGKKEEVPAQWPCRVGKKLRVVCEWHARETFIVDPSHWMAFDGGGCQTPCGRMAACGHPCKRVCHFDPMCVCAQCRRKASGSD